MGYCYATRIDSSSRAAVFATSAGTQSQSQSMKELSPSRSDPMMLCTVRSRPDRHRHHPVPAPASLQPGFSPVERKCRIAAHSRNTVSLLQSRHSFLQARPFSRPPKAPRQGSQGLAQRRQQYLGELSKEKGCTVLQQ